MKSDKPDLLDWLGLRRDLDFSKARWLGGSISGAIFLTLAILLVHAFIEFFDASWSDDPEATAYRNAGLVLAAMIGVPFLVWRSIVAQKQVDVAEQGQITDRINKTVEGLGADKTVKRQRMRETGKPAYVNVEGKPDYSQPIMEEVSLPNLEVRIGAIYALERIAQDSDRDHVQIMEILCAYIRQNTPADPAKAFPQKWQAAFDADWNDPEVERPDRAEIQKWANELEPPREDIQVALNVIGRRSAKQIRLEGQKDKDGQWQGYRLDLRNTCLQRAEMRGKEFSGALFEKAQLQGANPIGARLQGANLNEVQLQSAVLYWAQLQGAVLRRAQLQGALFEGAKLQEADLSAARLQWADIHEAQLQGAVLIGVQFSSATFVNAASIRGAAFRAIDLTNVTITQDQIDQAFGDATVTLPEGIERPQRFNQEYESWGEFRTAWHAWQAEIGFDPENPDG